jgi:hypothetical protein
MMDSSWRGEKNDAGRQRKRVRRKLLHGAILTLCVFVSHIGRYRQSSWLWPAFTHPGWRLMDMRLKWI